jgi:hypothetical protein
MYAFIYTVATWIAILAAFAIWSYPDSRDCLAQYPTAMVCK